MCIIAPRRDEPSAASRRHIAQHPLGHAQAPQSAAATPHTVPPQPKAFPDVSPVSNLPASKICSPILGQSVIPPPADHVPPPLGRQLPTRRWAAAAPDLPNLLLESRDTFPCYFPLLASVDAKPQKLALPRPPRSALRLVHLQSQLRLDPVPDPLEHPLRRRLAAHINVAVVGITTKAQPPALEFPIERVQVDVRQQTETPARLAACPPRCRPPPRPPARLLAGTARSTATPSCPESLARPGASECRGGRGRKTWRCLYPPPSPDLLGRTPAPRVPRRARCAPAEIRSSTR